MALISESELDAVNTAINAVEKNTDAELVVVLAARADDYRYIPTLWAAVVALLVPGILWSLGLWLEILEILLVQLGVFAALAVLFRVPVIMYKLVPSSVLQWRAANLARRQFLENNLHCTRNESGVLIFISEAEHYVEIIADRGIDVHVEASQWQAIVETLIGEIKNGSTQAGLISSINSCGTLLEKYVPATEQKNELPNHLVVI